MTQGKQQIAERIEQQGYSYDRIVATRESRQRPGYFIYWRSRNDVKQTSFVSDEEYKSDLDDMETSMGYEQENRLLVDIPL